MQKIIHMKKLTKAEEPIMQCIWELKKATVGQIRECLSGGNETSKPAHSTISTMLRILMEKKFLGHKAYGRTFEYFPLISKKEYSKSSINKLVMDYFDGSMNSLVSFLVKEEDIDEAELKDILKNYKAQKNK